MKKSICLLLALTVFCNLFLCFPLEAAAEKYQSFEYEYLEDGTIELAKYNGKEKSIEIPSSINDIPVTSIGAYAFQRNNYIQNVILPNSITNIGYSAFGGCMHLSNVGMSQNLKSIRSYAFQSCEALSVIIIPNSVTQIESYAFDHCSSLSNITLPNKLSEIPNNAFSFCSSLQSIRIPNSVTSIGKESFSCCWNLESITLSNNLKSIDKEAFYQCKKLSVITFPRSLETIGDGAFFSCESLINITIPESVHSIGESAFYDCILLKHISLPSGLSEIKRNTFGWSGLEVVDNLPNSIIIIGDNTFYNCDNLRSVIIPQSVKTIGEHAFDNCDSLVNLDIPKSVEQIKTGAFYQCSTLEKLTIRNPFCDLNEMFLAYTDADRPNYYTPIPETISDSLILYSYNNSTVQSFLKKKKRESQFVSLGSFNCEDYSRSHSYPIHECDEGDYTCSVCGGTYHVSENHTFEEWYEYKVNGVYQKKEKSKCSRCGKEYIRNCQEFEVISSVEPDCYNDGYTIYQCITCGGQSTITIDCLGHEFDIWESCGDRKHEESKCIRCGAKTTRDCSYYTCVVNPTCTDYGYTLHVCESCGDTYRDKYTSPLGHDYKWSIVIPPTQDNDGLAMRICNRCNLIEQLPIPATNSTTPSTTILLGDVDVDGGVSIIDATCIQRHLAELPVLSYNESAADTDGDGSVTIIDATCIQRWLASLPCPDGIGEPMPIM